jgi:hypothetical protein
VPFEGKQVPVNAGVEVQIHKFLTSAPDEQVDYMLDIGLPSRVMFGGFYSCEILWGRCQPSGI